MSLRLLTAEYMLSDSRRFGFAQHWFPRVIAEAFLGSNHDGEIKISPDPVTMIEGDLTWNNAADDPQYVWVMVRRGPRSIVTQSPSTVVIHDAWSSRIGPSPTADYPSVVQDTFGGRMAVDRPSVQDKNLQYGRFFIDGDDSQVYVDVGEVQPGDSFHFRYLCAVQTPGVWTEPSEFAARWEARARWARLVALACPVDVPAELIASGELIPTVEAAAAVVASVSTTAGWLGVLVTASGAVRLGAAARGSLAVVVDSLGSAAATLQQAASGSLALTTARSGAADTGGHYDIDGVLALTAARPAVMHVGITAGGSLALATVRTGAATTQLQQSIGGSLTGTVASGGSESLGKPVGGTLALTAVSTGAAAIGMKDQAIGGTLAAVAAMSGRVNLGSAVGGTLARTATASGAATLGKSVAGTLAVTATGSGALTLTPVGFTYTFPFPLR